LREKLVDQVLRSGVYRTPPTSGNVFRRDVCGLLRDVDYDRAVDGVILFAAPFFGEVMSLPEQLGYYRIHGRNDSGAGSAPGPALLERDLARFMGRMRHLQEIAEDATGRPLVAPAKTLYYRELLLFLDVVSRRRPPPGRVFGALAASLTHPGLAPGDRLLRGVFILLLGVLPNRQAARLLNYRFQFGARAAAFLRGSAASRALQRPGAAGASPPSHAEPRTGFGAAGAGSAVHPRRLRPSPSQLPPAV
jgi:hypothetical protein